MSISRVKGVKGFVQIIYIHSMVVMSTLSKDQSNYSVYCNTKSSNYMKL